MQRVFCLADPVIALPSAEPLYIVLWPLWLWAYDGKSLYVISCKAFVFDTLHHLLPLCLVCATVKPYHGTYILQLCTLRWSLWLWNGRTLYLSSGSVAVLALATLQCYDTSAFNAPEFCSINDSVVFVVLQYCGLCCIVVVLAPVTLSSGGRPTLAPLWPTRQNLPSQNYLRPTFKFRWI